ncbi:MAG: alpha/beta fold hydrolase [Myxococcota bacterium]
MTFKSGGDTCHAWFVRPEAPGGPRPCVVIGHGLGLTRRSGLMPIAERFARAGYSALVFDYRGFGDSGGAPRQVISFRGQREDWAAAVAFARSRADVDSEAVVAWGFSLGAGHAVSITADDAAIAAVIAVAPMLSGLSATLAAMRWWSLWNTWRIFVQGVRDCFATLFRRQPVCLPLSAPAGKLGLLTSPDAYPGYRAIVPDDFEFQSAAKIGLYFWSYSPGRRLKAIRAPTMVLPASLDKICPPGPTRARARSSPNSEVYEIECEHMAALTEPVLGEVLSASVDFLARHVPPPSAEVEQPERLR